MFDVAPTELLLLGAVAIVVIPPKDLPKAMRVAGYWLGRARGVTRQFRAGFDNIVREAELEEMQKKWAAENERIMREHPADLESLLDPPAPAAEAKPAPGEPDDPPPVMVEQPSLFEAPPPAPPPERP